MQRTRFSRQSFLGPNSQEIIERAVIGVIGLGGGGSHIVQQLAHIGFLNYVTYDPDIAEDHNLNRLVGAIENDIVERRLKIEIAERVIRGLRPQSIIEAYACRWQDKPEPLRSCDIVFGCVDGFRERYELEVCTRRYLIPYLDIGMDVHQVGNEAPRVGGQVILSLPGKPCMFCLGFLTNEKLSRDGERYGDAGVRPQVVWTNGVLASTAVGVAIDLLTGWGGSERETVYLSYDGNAGTMTPHIRLQYFGNQKCMHYLSAQVGDPVLKLL